MKKIAKIIKKSKRVGIIAHTSPDPDCLSSMTALSCILKQLKINCETFVDNTTDYDLYDFYSLNKDQSSNIDANKYDLLIAVDIANSHLMGKYYPVYSKFINTVAIDHHSKRDLRSLNEYIDISASSCSELIYKLAIELKCKITPEIATYLYAGIVGDTNCFENDNVNKNTFYIAGKCLECGANNILVNFIIHKKQTMESIKIKNLGYQNLTMDNGIAYVIFTKKMFKECGSDDIGNFVNEILNIDDNKIAYCIKQKDKNSYSVSLRCKKEYDVSIIAQKFGGGGHKQASGMFFTGAPTRHAREIYNECLKQIKGN